MARKAASSKVTVKAFGKTKEGDEIQIITMEIPSGMKVEVLTYGARLHSFYAPDKKGKYENIILQHDKVDAMSKVHSVSGAVIGRLAGRTENGKLMINKKEHQLELNDGEHHLHGGSRGFQHQMWKINWIKEKESPEICLYHVSGVGENGYPGSLEVTCSYRLSPRGLHVSFRAQSKYHTVFAPTLHTYFKLDSRANWKDHRLSLNGEYFLPLNTQGIPSSKPQKVEKWYDLRLGASVADILKVNDQQLDHCWLRTRITSHNHLATLSHVNGRRLDIYSSMPGLQVYGGIGLKGEGFKEGAGLALEAQYPPNVANSSLLEHIILHPDLVREETIEYIVHR